MENFKEEEIKKTSCPYLKDRLIENNNTLVKDNLTSSLNIRELKSNEDNIFQDNTINYNEEEITFESDTKSIFNILRVNYERIYENKEKREKLKLIKSKIMKVIRLIKVSTVMNPNLKTRLKKYKKISFSKLVMHPELSKIRFLIDIIIYIMIFIDIFLTPYEYMVISEKNKERWAIFDIIFSIEIIANFFTGFYEKQIINLKFKDIALNYLKFRFFLDVLYVFPFWYFYDPLEILRLIKFYRYFILLKHIRTIMIAILTYFIKNLKFVHSIVNIMVFMITLMNILNITSCIWVYLAKKNKEYVDIFGLCHPWTYYFEDKDTGFNYYILSLYLIIETFTTIGYGDIKPCKIDEIIFLMICEILNVGLYGYLISCIMGVILDFSTNEISFKLQKEDIDINIWLLKFINQIPLKTKNTKNINYEIFNDIKNNFDYFYKFESKWIKNFSFLKQMRPSERNILLKSYFSGLFNNFSSFFNGLESSFNNHIALNLKVKMIGEDEEIVSDKEDNKKNRLKYFYFPYGTISVYRDNTHITNFFNGSYFGDEFFFNNYSKYTFKNSNSKPVFILCCPIEVIIKFCSMYEQSFLILIKKAYLRKVNLESIYRKLKSNNTILYNESSFDIVNDYKKIESFDIDYNQLNLEKFGNLASLVEKKKNYMRYLEHTHNMISKLEFLSLKLKEMKTGVINFMDNAVNLNDLILKSTDTFYNEIKL